MLEINVHHLITENTINIVPYREYGSEFILGKSCLLAVCTHGIGRWVDVWKDDDGRYQALNVAWVHVQGREHL